MKLADLSASRQSVAIELYNRRIRPEMSREEAIELEHRTCSEVAAQRSEIADLDTGGLVAVIMVGDRVDVGHRVGTLTATRVPANPAMCEVMIADRYHWVEPWQLTRHYCKPRHVHAANQCACGWELVDGSWTAPHAP